MGWSKSIPLECPSAIIVTKITATAPAAPEINPGLPPKIAATKPTIKAPVSAISGSICATKAKATTSGIIANDTVTPLRISFFGLVVNLWINLFIVLDSLLKVGAKILIIFWTYQTEAIHSLIFGDLIFFHLLFYRTNKIFVVKQ